MKLPKLYFITLDASPYSHAEQAKGACQGGAKLIQLRTKNKDEETWLRLALEVQTVCKKYGAIFIVNDNVELTKEIKADGLHLGKYDMPIPEARQILGNDYIIGGSTNTFEDILRVAEWKADYMGSGPYKFTTTKVKEELNPLLGIKGYQENLRKYQEINISIPIYAIGGIKQKDIPVVMQLEGIYGVAISSLIANAENKPQVTEELLQIIESC